MGVAFTTEEGKRKSTVFGTIATNVITLCSRFWLHIVQWCNIVSKGLHPVTPNGSLPIIPKSSLRSVTTFHSFDIVLRQILAKFFIVQIDWSLVRGLFVPIPSKHIQKSDEEWFCFSWYLIGL